MLGVVLATLVLQMVSTLMNMFSGLSAFYRDVIWGALLIIMLIVNHTLDARRGGRALKEVRGMQMPRQSCSLWAASTAT